MKRYFFLIFYVFIFFIKGYSQWPVFKTTPDTIEANFIIEDIQIVTDFEVKGLCKNYHLKNSKLFYITLMCNEKIYLVIYNSPRKNKKYNKLTIGDSVSLKLYPLLSKNRFPNHNSFQDIRYKKYYFWLTYGLSWATNIYYSPKLEMYTIVIKGN